MIKKIIYIVSIFIFNLTSLQSYELPTIDLSSDGRPEIVFYIREYTC